MYMVPIPVSATVCGEFVALSTIVSVAVSAEGCVGLKVTWMAQDFPGDTVLPQVWGCVKSGLVARLELEMLRGTSPPLVSVTA
jgi:hypothetical protein